MDWALLTGLAAVGALALVAVYGPLVAPHDPYHTRPPFQGVEPSAVYPLGTDALGHDRLSWLLYGARTTIVIAFAAATLRSVLGGFLGAFAAWQGGRAERILSWIAVGLSSIPLTIAALMGVLAFNARGGYLSFILGLGLVGWVDAFHQTRRAVRTEAARPHIEGARALGVSEQRVVLAHMLPNVAPRMLTTAALQLSTVFLLLGELALLRIFVGGALTDAFGQPSPAEPEWASMLGATRPIFDLYGNAIAVLAPGAALLFAVISTNLLADALAREAQRRNVVSLVTRRTAATSAAVVVLLIVPAALWPSRLAQEIAYARDFDAARALAVTRSLAADRFDGRYAESAGARAAADEIRQLVNGSLTDVRETVRPITAARLAVGGVSVALGPDLSVVAPGSMHARGPLVVTRFGTGVTRTTSAPLLNGAIVVVRAAGASNLDLWEQLASRAGAAALIFTDTEAFASENPYSVPAIVVPEAALEGLLGRELLTPVISDPPLALGVDAEIDITASQRAVGGVDVIARVPARASPADLIVVAAPYDQFAGVRYVATRPGWRSASAAGVLIAAAERVRRDPLPVEIVFVSAASQDLENAGLKAALRSLTPDELARTRAVIVVQGGSSTTTTLRSDPSDPSSPTAGGRVGPRVANAMGQRYTTQRTLTLPRALAGVGVRAPTFELVSIAAQDDEPSAGALAASGRLLLALIAYCALHPEEVRG